MSAILSALILTVRIVLPGYGWTCGHPSRSYVDRAGGMVVTGLLLNLLPVLPLMVLGLWTPVLDWLLWGLVTGVGFGRKRSLFNEQRWASILRLGQGLVLVGLVTVVPMLLPIRSEWLAGGWDPGLYLNNSVAIARRDGWRPMPGSLYTELSPGDRQLLSDGSQSPYHEIMPGVPIRLRDGSLPLYFPPLTSLCGAWMVRIGGMPMLLRLPSLLAFIGLLPFLAFCGMAGLTSWQRFAALGFVLLSPIWWYHQAVPTSEMLSLILLYGGVLFYERAVKTNSRFPIGAMLVLFAAMLNHLAAALLAGGLLATAAVWESLRPPSHRGWRLVCCFTALLAGIGWNVHFSWITLFRLQEQNDALSLILAVTLFSGVLVMALLCRRDPQSFFRMISRCFRGPALASLIFLIALSGGAFAAYRFGTLDRIFWGSLPLVGAFLNHYSQLLIFQGIALCLLSLAGLGLIISDRELDPSVASLRAVTVFFGLVLILLIAAPGITPIFPWAFRRFLVMAVPFMSLTQGYAVFWAAARIRTSPVRGVALLLLAFAAVAGGIQTGSRAVRVGDYRGLSGVLAKLDRLIEPGDTVVVDDARWGTPLMLVYGHDVVNGERLEMAKSAEDQKAILDVLGRIQALQRGRLLWLTSRESGTDQYAMLPVSLHPFGPVSGFNYRIVIHEGRQRSFKTTSQRAEFRFYEQVAGTPPPLVISRPGPYRLLADVHDGTSTPRPTALQWGGHPYPLPVFPRTGLQVMDLPEPSAEGVSMLNWSHSTGRPPSFQLFGAGDALELICRRRWVLPSGFLSPRLNPAGVYETVIPLPFTEGAAAVHMTLSGERVFLPELETLRVQIGGREVAPALDSRRPVVQAFLPVEAPLRQAVVDTSGLSPGARLELRLQPCYPSFDAMAVKGGIYVFDVLDSKGNSAGRIARRLEAGVPRRVSAPAGSLVGACVHYHDAKFLHRSSMEDDPLIQFEGFHDREPTADPVRPYQRWSASGEAFIHVLVPPDQSLRVSLRLRDVRPPDVEYERMEVRVGDHVHPVVFFNRIGLAELDVSLADVRDKDTESVMIQLISDTWVPSAVIASGDHRRLGFLLDEVSVRYEVLNEPDPDHAIVR